MSEIWDEIEYYLGCDAGIFYPNPHKFKKPMIDNKKSEIKVEIWEADEYIITINGKPTGQTLSDIDAQIVKRWLETAKELWMEADGE